MDWFYGVALLVLSVGMVILFAMFGELASRLPNAGASEYFEPLETDAVGSDKSIWLQSTFGSPKIDDVLVLSSSCTSCLEIVAEPDVLLNLFNSRKFAVLLSCPSFETGAEFAQTRLSFLPSSSTRIDVGGRDAITEFGVSSSPVLLRFDNGCLQTGWQLGSRLALEKVLGFDRSS